MIKENQLIETELEIEAENIDRDRLLQIKINLDKKTGKTIDKARDTKRAIQPATDQTMTMRSNRTIQIKKIKISQLKNLRVTTNIMIANIKKKITTILKRNDMYFYLKIIFN